MLIAFLTLIFNLTLPLLAAAEIAAPTCDIPLELVRLANPLHHFARRLANNKPIRIVAIGSSSTAGAGASAPVANYPNRLATELKQNFPNSKITMINRGANGEDAGDMFKRLDSVVVATKPNLVLWQFGTNSIIRGSTLIGYDAAIRDGLKRIRASGADVVLIDPQYAPKVIEKTGAEGMVHLIAATAKHENVNLFRRFDMMKRWREIDHMGFQMFLSSDGLHMNDWSYACMAKGLAIAIADAAQRPTVQTTPKVYVAP